MKKISLLLILSFLLAFSGIAQRNQLVLHNAIPTKKSTEKNFAYKSNPASSAIVQNSPKQIEAYLSESFEGAFLPVGWTKQDPDGGTGWDTVSNGTTPIPGFNGGTQTVPTGGGNYAAYCSYATGGTAADNQWLITPQFAVTTGDSLKFYLYRFGAYQDTLYVKLSTTTNATASFTTTLLTLDTMVLNENWKRFSISLTPYAGQNIYIAFQEKVADNQTNGAYFALDLLSMGVASPNDVATSSIDVPVINAPGSITPKATVANVGSLVQTFDVTMKISGGYTSTKTVTALASGASIQVSFDPWTAVNGKDTIKVYTQLAGDSNTGNDTLVKPVKVFLDAASTSIDMPAVVGVGLNTPKATIINNGGDATSFNVTMKISGGYTSTKTVATLATGASTQITFDPWTAALGTDTIVVYTQLTGDTIHTNDTLKKIVSVQTLKKVYCYVAYDASGAIPAGPAYTYLQAPNIIVSLADQSAQNFVGAGTWGGLNKWYGVEYSSNNLITLDTVTGARTVIGNVGHSISGMSYDYSTNKLYGVSWDGSASSLYSISTANGAGSLIGQSSTDLLINLACDNTGHLYTVGVNTDSLYSLNKTTGASTIIGGIGFNAGYAQDMEFDRNNNILYMAAYNAGTSVGEMRTVNVTTGATTLIGSFADSAEVTGFAIPFNASLPAIDASISAYTSPVSACGLGNENVTVIVQNLGTTSISSVPVHYKINGGTAVNETISSTIPAGGFVSYTFTAQANLSTPGIYTIKAYSTMTGDAIAANDTITFTVQNVSNATVPYTMGFEPAEDFTGWSIQDVNADGSTWSIVSTGGNTAPYCAKYVYNSANAANDWLVSKCIQLDASKTYKLTYYYKAESATFPESLKTYIGTAPASTSLTTLINDLPSVVVTTYTQSATNFTVPSTGVYYIGWKCYSAADEYNLYVDDINITEVSGITENVNNSDISVFPNPTKDVLNITATGTISRIKVLNVFGQLVYTNEVNAENTKINTGAFANGIYYIQIETKNGIVTKSVSVNK